MKSIAKRANNLLEGGFSLDATARLLNLKIGELLEKLEEYDRRQERLRDKYLGA